MTGKKVVLFDAYELVYGYGKSLGIYKYAVKIFRELINLVPDEFEIVLVCNSKNKSDFCTDVNISNIKYKVKCYKIRKMSSMRKIVWQWYGAPKIITKLMASVYFNPKGFIPGMLNNRINTKYITTIHDLIPHWYVKNNLTLNSGISGKYVVWAMQNAVKRADGIITVSDTTKKYIKEYFKRDEAINTVYCGLDPIGEVSEVKPHEKDYFFAIGSPLVHKNVDLLLKAYEVYKKKEKKPITLVICSKEKDSNGILYVSNLTDKDLAQWYKHAKCFIFPSLIEGFGFPPLEAMQYGVPVIASDTLIQREILGDACMYFDPMSEDSLADALLTLLQNEGEQKKYKLAGIEQCKKYTWNECGRKVMDILKKM